MHVVAACTLLIIYNDVYVVDMRWIVASSLNMSVSCPWEQVLALGLRLLL